MMFKKSQVTVFIIIAIVLVAFFGITYYMIMTNVVERGEEQILRQQISSEKIDPIREYITSCFRLSASEGLKLLGKQGGYIYVSQGGIVPDPLESELGQEFIDYEQTKIHYGIYAPVSNIGNVFYSQPPDYPWPAFPRRYNRITGEYSAKKFEGYFGRNKVPPLEKTKEDSIQENLEKYTVNGTLKCIDWDAFEVQGLRINSSAPNVSVVFAESDVSFTMDFPVTITDTATGAVTDIKSFTVSYGVRMKKILNFTAKILDSDVTDITYDIRASDGTISSSAISDVFGRDDLIVVKDTESRILDDQYEFRFARKNRAPALHFINNQTDIKQPICGGSLIQFVNPNKLNIVDSCEDNSFELELNTSDPDEDIVEFTFNKQLPYEVQPVDVNTRRVRLKIEVSDGEYKDWQEITIKTKQES